MKRLIKSLILLLIFVFLFSILLNTKSMATNNFKNYVIYIDPGHGGYDGGAVGINGIVEKDINLLISIYLKNYLEQLGIKVYMTRDKDVDYTDYGEGTKKKRDLLKRLDMINNSDADLFVSIHMNALPNPKWYGAQTFYFPNFEENKIIANYIQQNLKNVLKNTNRIPKIVKTLYLFKNVEKPGVLVEAGFLSNPYEANLLNQPSYQDKVAFAIFLGIIEFIFESSYTPIY